tara:strand:+ start:109 stop:249 length:141 start_codon:yes stop_codon:yes gene_type:complete
LDPKNAFLLAVEDDPDDLNDDDFAPMKLQEMFSFNASSKIAPALAK